MDFLPISNEAAEALVVLGVDTHADVHVAVALDGLGRRLGAKTVPTTEAGYAALLAWAEGFGTLDRIGVEGSGSFVRRGTRPLPAHQRRERCRGQPTQPSTPP